MVLLMLVMMSEYPEDALRVRPWGFPTCLVPEVAADRPEFCRPRFFVLILVLVGPLPAPPAVVVVFAVVVVVVAG